MQLFFQAAVVSILLYGCTTWTLSKPMEKKLDSNYTRMLRAILNKSGRQHPTKQHLYGHLPPITKTIQVRRTRHAGHCWRSKDELISDILQWTPSHGRWLHSYRCFDIFNFLSSVILIWFLWSDVLVLRACVDLVYISLHLLHSVM